MSTAYSSAKQQYIGNGVTTEWGFDFPIKKHSELKVYLKRSVSPQVLLEEGVDYSFVTENTIAFPIKTGEAKLQASDVLALQRESVFESEYNFSNQQRLEPEEVMHADDNLERQIQELKRDVNQAIRIQPTSNINTDEYFVAVESIYENLDNINNVSGISSEIVNCSDNISDISTVSTNIANVNAVGQSISNVNTVAGDISSVNTVAGVSTDVTTVASIASSVPTVANNDTNITTVATNISNVNTAATNIEAIKDAPNQAASAQNSAAQASQSATSASDSAQAAQNALNEVQGLIATPIGTIFQSVYVDESLDIARQLNGQLISSTKFTGFRSWLNTVQASLPNLFTTEVNWQAEKTNSKLGQCGKFVVDDTAGTIRLPCVVNAQGLLSLSGIGNLVNESLPNITGRVGNIYIGSTSQDWNGALSSEYGSGGDRSAGSSITSTIKFDASHSSSTYQTDAPVQQEAVQYPYYIQVATGVEETLPAIREYKINTPFFFGQSIYSDVAPDNASWLVSNGQYNARSVYPDYYDWLLEKRNSNTKTFYLWKNLDGDILLFLTETNTLSVGSNLYGYNPTIKFGEVTAISGNNVTVRNDLANTTNTIPTNLSNPTYAGNIPVYDSSKMNVISKEVLDNWNIPTNTSDYDFVINTADQTFRLPLKNGQEGIFADGVKGNGMGLGLTNGTKNVGMQMGSEIALLESLYGTQVGSSIVSGNSPSGHYGITTDPSKSGMVVDKTVPSGWNLYYYVGDTVQDASLINAGAVLGQLSDKISRTAASDRELVVGWGIPDYTAGISKGWNNFTADFDGVIYCYSGVNAGTNTVSVNGAEVYRCGNNNYTDYNGALAPVSKNDVITVSGSTYDVANIIFYPLKGAN